jgi:pSer/pThr/pTyr-binding forkhead associated (FHA) protein
MILELLALDAVGPLPVGHTFRVTCVPKPEAHAAILTIGRDQGNIILLPVVSVSGRHAEMRVPIPAAMSEAVRHAPTGVTVSDLGSQNGTFVNGRRCSGPRQPSIPLPVNHRDEVRFGSFRFELSLLPKRIEPPTLANPLPLPSRQVGPVAVVAPLAPVWRDRAAERRAAEKQTTQLADTTLKRSRVTDVLADVQKALQLARQAQTDLLASGYAIPIESDSETRVEANAEPTTGDPVTDVVPSATLVRSPVMGALLPVMGPTADLCLLVTDQTRPPSPPAPVGQDRAPPVGTGMAVAERLLRRMGWAGPGHGLGKLGTGRSIPVPLDTWWTDASTARGLHVRTAVEREAGLVSDGGSSRDTVQTTMTDRLRHTTRLRYLRLYGASSEEPPQ